MTVGTDETLAWEARQRPRAALAALGAALLIIGSYVASGLAFSDPPRSSLLPSLGRAAQPGPVDATRSLKIPFYEFYSDRAGALLGASAARSLGFLLVGLALTFLAQAVARRGDLPNVARYAPMVGGVLSALSFIASPLGTVFAVNSFLDGDRTVGAARDVVSSTPVVVAAAIGFLGGAALAVAFVLVCINAMRVGLLTRFMGVLGILAGVLTFLPIGSPLPVVQCFWLAALGLLFFGRWPGGQPPAWGTGKAEAWPTQQELRERAAGRPAAAPKPAVAAAAAGATGAPHPASKKRKRKRRS